MDPKPVPINMDRLPGHGGEPDAVPAPEQAPVPAGSAQAGPPAGGAQDIEEQVIAALKTCYDPEIPVNIYEMGLIYGIELTPDGAVHIRMTLTSPACPVAGTLPPEVQTKVEGIPGVKSAKVEVVWDPPWTPDRMSEAARLQLGMF